MGHAQCESLGLDKGLLYEKKSFKRAGFVHGNEMKGRYVIYVSKAVIKTCAIVRLSGRVLAYSVV